MGTKDQCYLSIEILVAQRIRERWALILGYTPDVVLGSIDEELDELEAALILRALGVFT